MIDYYAYICQADKLGINSALIGRVGDRLHSYWLLLSTLDLAASPLNVVAVAEERRRLLVN